MGGLGGHTSELTDCWTVSARIGDAMCAIFSNTRR